MKIAITGANGFLGSHIVRKLSRSNFDVISIVRIGSNTRFIDKTNSKIVKVDYENETSIFNALDGVELLIHNAALAKDWGKYDDFKKINIDLTKRIYSIAKKAQIDKIIHISSNAVLGEEDNLTKKSETAPYNPKINYFLEEFFESGMNFYKTTKKEGEVFAIDFSKKKRINLTVLRPVWIFGPREFNSGPYEYSKTVTCNLPFFPGTDSNLFHSVYVEDVAAAVNKAIEADQKGINIYNIGHKNILKMDKFYGIFCKFLKVKKPINIPKFVILPFVLPLEFLFIFLKISFPPILTRARLYMMYANNVYDVSKIEKELGFTANTDYEYAIRKTVKWWKLNKFL